MRVCMSEYKKNEIIIRRRNIRNGIESKSLHTETLPFAMYMNSLMFLYSLLFLHLLMIKAFFMYVNMDMHVYVCVCVCENECLKAFTFKIHRVRDVYKHMNIHITHYIQAHPHPPNSLPLCVIAWYFVANTYMYTLYI